MDYSRDQMPNNNGGDNGFMFRGFWEVIHNEQIGENGNILCLLKKRNGQEFPVPTGIGGRPAVDDMVNNYLQQNDLVELDMIFEEFYALQGDLGS